MAQAIVAIKQLHRAKERLAAVLNSRQRQSLALAMLSDVLQQLLTHKQITKVWLLSGEREIVTELPKFDLYEKLEVVIESDVLAAIEKPVSKLDGDAYLNSLLEQLCKTIPRTNDDQVLISHADLPLISSEDLSTVITQLQRGNTAVLGVDSRGRGSNLLAFDLEEKIQLRFGVGSYKKHRDYFSKYGKRAEIVESLGVSLDIDNAADLAKLQAYLCDSFISSQRARHTRIWLEKYLASAPATNSVVSEQHSA